MSSSNKLLNELSHTDIGLSFMTHFKQRLYIGPDYTPGVSNVQRDGLSGVENSDTLCPPNKNWRCTLDPYQWALWDAHNTNHMIFLLGLQNPDRVVLEANGMLHIVDRKNTTLWSRGPFGVSESYELCCEDQGDIALYNTSKIKVWSAVRDGV